MTRKFEVPDASTRKNKEYVSKISDLFIAKENNRSSKFIDDYISNINNDRQSKEVELLTDDEINKLLEKIIANLEKQGASLRK